MNRFCQERGIKFYVVLIPTKENVFAEYIGRKNAHLPNEEAIHDLLKNEREIGDLTKKFFNENHIAYIDVLDPLRRAVGRQMIYPTNADSHPNRNGYEIIARTIGAQLNDDSTSPKN